MQDGSSSKPEFHVTYKARDEALRIMDRLDWAPYGLRVGVVGGGCNGYSYKMEWTGDAKDGDHVFVNGRLKVIIDPKSMALLEGTTLRWGESLMEYGFQLDNPNVKKSCGCGSSFDV